LFALKTSKTLNKTNQTGFEKSSRLLQRVRNERKSSSAAHSHLFERRRRRRSNFGGEKEKSFSAFILPFERRSQRQNDARVYFFLTTSLFL